MKKLLSIILTAITLLTVFTVPVTASAKSKSSETTYKASGTIFGNSNGNVYRTGNKLVFKSANSKAVTLAKIDADNDAGFYMRGKTVYYTVSKSNKYSLYSISISGKNKKKIAGNIGYLIGGYGKYCIVKKGKTVNKIDGKGKISKVKTLSSKIDYITLFFDGKLYCKYKNNTSKYYVYDLKTKKGTDINGTNLKNGKKSLFYLNDNKLMRVDLKGKTKQIDNDVFKIYGANDGTTVVYSKKDNSDKEIFYRKTADKKSVQLCTIDDIEKKVLSIIEKAFPDYNTLNGVQSATIGKNEICFEVSHYEYEDSTDMLLTVSVNGGELSLLDRNKAGRINNINAVNNTVCYLIANTEDFPYTYKAKTI